MGKKKKCLSKQEIEKAIFEGIYPTKILKVPPLTLILVVNDGSSTPRSVEDWFNFFENALFIPGLEDSRVFLREIPFSFFEKIVQEYIELHSRWMSSALLHMPNIIVSDRSRVAWQVFNKAPIEKVLPISDRLNTAQYYWVVFNAAEDKKDLSDMITNLFDAIKPWLNSELWSRMEENKTGGSGRLNRFYDEQIRKFDEKVGLRPSQTTEDDVDEIVMEPK